MGAQSALSATSDLAVTGCAEDYYQSAGTSATDGVCTACAGTTELAAANFKGTTTTCAPPPCTIPAYGWKITAGAVGSLCAAAGTQLASDATCTVVVAAGYTASGTGVNTCNNAQSALSATSDLAVTGCLANFYQSAGPSAADGVCTACVGGTLAAAAFGSSTTTCVATCKLPALGYKIVKGTCGAAGQTAAADSTCTVAADTGYASAGSADNVCAASSASFTPNALAVTGCLANFYQSGEP